MIKANELRIGNAVLHKRSDEDYYRNYFISGIDVSNNDSIIAVLENGSDFYRMSYENDGNLAPIPVTPEILEKCANRKKDEDYWAEDGEHIFPSISYYWELEKATIHIRYFLKEQEIYLWIKYNAKEKRSYMSEELKFYENQFLLRKKDFYLHQLQNLYFALTGEELAFSYAPAYTL